MLRSAVLGWASAPYCDPARPNAGTSGTDTTETTQDKHGQADDSDRQATRQNRRAAMLLPSLERVRFLHTALAIREGYKMHLLRIGEALNNDTADVHEIVVTSAAPVILKSFRRRS